MAQYLKSGAIILIRPSNGWPFARSIGLHRAGNSLGRKPRHPANIDPFPSAF